MHLPHPEAVGYSPVMAARVKVIPTQRGPAGKGKDPLVALRMPADEQQAIEAWGAKHSPPLSFSKAFRQLAQNGLAAST
jgi:hypothetical protein